jgi:hypothetical protein
MNQNLFNIQLNYDKNLVSREAKTERIIEIRAGTHLFQGE